MNPEENNKNVYRADSFEAVFGEHVVERLGKALRGDAFVGKLKGGALPAGVHARVGAAGAVKLNGAARQGRKRQLQLSADRLLAGLALPAAEVRPVISNCQKDISHFLYPLLRPTIWLNTGSPSFESTVSAM